VLGIGRALRAAGWEVRFATGPAEGRPDDRQPDGSYRFDGFEYLPLGEAESVDRALSARVGSFLRRGQRSILWLDREKPVPGDVVIAYNAVVTQLVRLRRWCVAGGVPLIVDCTEWYEPFHQVGGRFGPLRLAEEWRMRITNRKVDGIIAISRFLQAYYSTAALEVIRVPPLVDLEDPKWRARLRPGAAVDPVFIYAGVPGKKDLLGHILRACSMAAEAGARFRLVVAGPSRGEVEAALVDERIPAGVLASWVDAKGLVDQERIPGLLSGADFSILARPPHRYAAAGFPTKVVESLAAGTPPLLNITGDLGEYIREGENGIVARDHSAAELATAIRRAVAMDHGARSAMRARARRTAETCFDYRVFVGALDNFVDSVAARRPDSRPETQRVSP
jgi:glycosyltransferase involved in cell wall biosynthesis